MRLLFILLIVFGLIFYGLVDSRPSNAELWENLKIDTVRTDVNQYEAEGIKIRYVDIGSKTGRMLIFIHGAPGSLEAFNAFLKDTLLRSKFRMLAVDRPGYGASNFGIAETSLARQARLIAPLLEENRNECKPIVIGHSFGGTIAARMAMDYPDKSGGLILVGAAVDPEHEKFFTIAKLVEIPVINRIVPESMKVAHAEKYTHISELEKMRPGWGKIHTKVIVLHGAADGLVPVENAYYAERNLVNAEVKMSIYENLGHLIPWTQPELLVRELMEFSEE